MLARIDVVRFINIVMIKILFFNNLFPTESFPQKGAYAKTIRDMLVDCGFSVDTCVKEYSGSSKVDKFLSYIKFYYRLCFVKLNKSDLLYINHYLFLIPLMFRLPFYKGKVVFHWHGEELVNKKFFLKILKFLAKKTLPLSATHISPSIYYTKIINEELKVLKNKIYVYPSGGVDIDTFVQYNKETNDEIHIGFPAELSEHKGIGYLYKLIENTSLLELKLKRKVCFHVIKYGTECLNFLEYIKDNHIQNVYLYDMFERKNLFKFYKNIDITLFLSKRESLGLTVLESFACGVPVIAMNNSSMPELIKCSQTGELLPNNPSVDEIIDTMKFILDNRTVYNPRPFVEENYSAIKAIEMLNCIIKKAIN